MLSTLSLGSFTDCCECGVCSVRVRPETEPGVADLASQACRLTVESVVIDERGPGWPMPHCAALSALGYLPELLLPEAEPPVLLADPGLALPERPVPVVPGAAVLEPGGAMAAGSDVPGVALSDFPLDIPVLAVPAGVPRPDAVEPGLDAPDWSLPEGLPQPPRANVTRAVPSTRAGNANGFFMMFLSVSMWPPPYAAGLHT